MNSKQTLEQLTGTAIERKKAAIQLKEARQRIGQSIKELSVEEIERRLWVLRHGTQDEINALEPLDFSGFEYTEGLTDDQIKERLDRIINRV